MLNRQRRFREQQGFVLVAALVLVALLFFIETALAVAVTGALHAVNVVDHQAAVRFTAESAAARGISGHCSGGSLNGLSFTTTCFSVGGIQAPDPTAVGQRANPSSALPAGACLTTRVFWENQASVVIWTVLAWRGPAGGGTLTVWTDDTPDCSGGPGGPCLQTFAGAAQPHLFTCQATGEQSSDLLHVIANAPVSLGPFVVRSAAPGTDAAVIAVGQAGTELDEAEVIMPNGNSTPAGEDLWNTVLQ